MNENCIKRDISTTVSSQHHEEVRMTWSSGLAVERLKFVFRKYPPPPQYFYNIPFAPPPFLTKIFITNWYSRNCNRRAVYSESTLFNTGMFKINENGSDLSRNPGSAPWLLRARPMLLPMSHRVKSLIMACSCQRLVLLLRIICVIYNVLSLSCFCVCSLLPCGHLLEKGWPLGSCLWCFIRFLSLSHVVSWVRCGTWLYLVLFDYWVFHNRSSKIIGQEVSIDDRL